MTNKPTDEEAEQAEMLKNRPDETVTVRNATSDQMFHELVIRHCSGGPETGAVFMMTVSRVGEEGAETNCFAHGSAPIIGQALGHWGAENDKGGRGTAMKHLLKTLARLKAHHIIDSIISE